MIVSIITGVALGVLIWFAYRIARRRFEVLREIDDMRRYVNREDQGGLEMDRTIFKYPLDNGTVNDIQLPGDSRILSVAEQHGRLFLWAEVDRSSSPSWQKIAVLGTGWAIPERAGLSRKFIGTVVQDGGSLVWHIYHYEPKGD